MNQGITQRRIGEFTIRYGRTDEERQHQYEAGLLAAHAALPVILNADLVHLLRINFLPHLPYTAEAYLLLSPLCSEIGGGLYEMGAQIRELLLRKLVEETGPNRLGEIATLLWKYSREHAPWVNEEGLEKAQELTALNFIDIQSASAWLEAAEAQSRDAHAPLTHAWYVAMRKEMEYGAQVARQVSVLQASPEALLARLQNHELTVQERTEAIYALGKLSSNATLEQVLRAVLADPSEDPVVRAAIADTLGQLDSTGPVTPLVAMLRDSEMGNIVGRSPKMRQIYDLIARVADTNQTVLISGESGVGKELIARAIHQQSQRHGTPFIAVNCAAISEHLMESELFGHERGAFTGAVEMHRGKFELAHTGTLFLDEVGSLRLDLQAKLLRVLQEREFERVGGNKTIRTDVRIVAASNQDLRQMVAERTFRDDLFYRLNVVPLHVPPLRDRREDIPLLVNHFLTKYNKAFGRQVQGFTTEALTIVTHYHWPGNVRELENVVERLVVISRHRILGVEDMPLDLISVRGQLANDLFATGTDLRQAKAEFERHYILQTLEKHGWNQTEAAKRLGIHRNTLLTKMDMLHIRPIASSESSTPKDPES